MREWSTRGTAAVSDDRGQHPAGQPHLGAGRVPTVTSPAQGLGVPVGHNLSTRRAGTVPAAGHRSRLMWKLTS